MDKLLKRSLTLLLAFVMVFTMMPMTAMATDTIFRLTNAEVASSGNLYVIPWDGEALTVGTEAADDIQYAGNGSKTVNASWFDKNGAFIEQGAPTEMGDYQVKLHCDGKPELVADVTITSGIRIVVSSGSDHPESIVGDTMPIAIGNTEKDEHENINDIIYTVNPAGECDHVVVTWYDHNDDVLKTTPTNLNEYYVKVTAYKSTDDTDVLATAKRNFFIKNATVIDFNLDEEYVYDTHEITAIKDLGLTVSNYGQRKEEIEYYWFDNKGKLVSTDANAGPVNVGNYSLKVVAPESEPGDSMYVRAEATKYFSIVEATPIIKIADQWKYYDGKVQTKNDVVYDIVINTRSGAEQSVKDALYGDVSVQFYASDGNTKFDKPKYEDDYTVRLGIAKHANFKEVLESAATPVQFDIRTASTTITAKDHNKVAMTSADYITTTFTDNYYNGKVNQLKFVSQPDGVGLSVFYMPYASTWTTYSDYQFSAYFDVNGVDENEIGSPNWTHGIDEAKAVLYKHTGSGAWTEISKFNIDTELIPDGTSLYAIKFDIDERVSSDAYGDHVNYASASSFYVFQLSKADGYINFTSTATERVYNGTPSTPGTIITVGTSSDCDIQFEYDTNMEGQITYSFQRLHTHGSNPTWSDWYTYNSYMPSYAGKYRIEVKIEDDKFNTVYATFSDFTVTKATSENIHVYKNETIEYDEQPLVCSTASDADVRYEVTYGYREENIHHRDVQVKWFAADMETPVSASNVKNPGKYYVQLTLPEGYNFTGYQTEKIEVKIVNANAKILASDTNIIYNGKPVVITNADLVPSNSNYVTYEYDGDGEVKEILFFDSEADTSTTKTISTPVNAGTYWAKVVIDKGTYSAATEKVFSFTIEKSNPTIAFTTPATNGETVLYTGQPIIAGIESSGNDIIYEFVGELGNRELNTSGIGNVSIEYAQNTTGLTYSAIQGGTQIIQTGKYKATISVAESQNYYASNEIELEFIVRYDRKIIATPRQIVYDAQPVNLSDDFNVTINRMVNGSVIDTDITNHQFSKMNVQWLSSSGSNISTPSDAGEYKVKLVLITDSDYVYATTTTDFVIERRALTTAVASGSDRIYDGTSEVDGYIVTFGNLAGSDVLALTEDYTAPKAYTTSSNVGTYGYTSVVTLVSNGNIAKNYCFGGSLAAGYVFAVTASSLDTMDIQNKSLDVKFFTESGTPYASISNLIPNLIYNGQDRIFTTVASDKTGRYTANNIITSRDFVVKYFASGSNTELEKVVNAGTYTIEISATSDGNYKDVLTKTFVINKKPVNVKWTNKTPYVYNAAAQCPIAEITSGDLETNILTGIDTCTVTVIGAATNSNAFTHTTQYYATATDLSNTNYDFATSAVKSQTYKINQKPVTIAWGNTNLPFIVDTYQTPTASITNLCGSDTCEFTISGAQKEAGTLYNAKIENLVNTNYTLVSGSDISTTFAIYHPNTNVVVAPGGGGGGGAAFSTITLTSVPHGKFTATPEKVLLGQTITITATPDEGYELSSLMINGKTVTGTVNADGTVTYVIEKATVATKVSGVFAEKKAEEKPAEETPAVTYTVDNAKTAAAAAVIKARSVRTAKGVKVTIVGDENLDELLANGYTVEYKFYKSTKAKSGYAYKLTKKTNVYTNTTDLKVGTRYYFKARLVVKDASGEVVYTSPLKQCKYATRVIK